MCAAFFRKKSGAAGRKEAEALNPQSEQLVGSNIKLSKEYFFIPYLTLPPVDLYLNFEKSSWENQV